MTKISSMGRAELLKLQGQIEKRLKRLEADDRKKALKAAQDAAKKFGYSLGDLTEGATQAKPKAKTGGKARAKAPAKYRDPDTGKEWSGRGRRPAWIKTAGDDLSKYEI